MRRSAVLLLPAAALTLAACGSDTTDGNDRSTAQAIPRCTQVPTAKGTTATPDGKVLCLGTAGVSELGLDGGVVRIAVTDVSRAPVGAIDDLEIGTANGEKKGATLWYVKVEASIVKSTADLDGTDPAEVINLKTAGGDDGKRYVSGAPKGCEHGRFEAATVGTAAVSCTWALLPEGEQPGVVEYAGDYSKTPTLTWAARS